ncbi:MlaD family protein [Saprospiraceae bacterium]|nr:MlaD family protein [Saprospiraceae bacterium]
MRKEVKIGALVLIVAAFAVWGYNFLKGQDLFSKSLTLETNYGFVDQLSPSSPVLINGVKVGNVTQVELDQSNVKNVIVRFTIEDVTHVPKTAVATLISTGIMGGKAIDIVFARPCAGNGDCLSDGDKLQSRSLGMLTTMLGENAIDGYVETAQAKIKEMMGTENGGESDFTAMMADLKASIGNLNNITEKVNKILASSAYDVKNVTNNLEDFTTTLNASSSKLTSIIDNVDAVTTDLKNANISKTVNTAESALAETQTAITSIKSTIETTNQTMARVTDLINKVERGEGSLGLLVNDKKLYQDLQNTSSEIGLLLQDVRLNPKRYINVSVFGKKQKDYVLPEEDPAKGN